MFAKTLPLLLLCACAAAPPAPGSAQPRLAELVQPYLSELQSVGIARLVASDADALVRLETLSGPVYVRYPPDLPRTAFVLDIDPAGVHATAATFDSALDQRVLDALLPDVITATTLNNQLVWIRNNPWH